MNEPAPLQMMKPVKLTAADCRLLKRSGAFVESDTKSPIKLRIEDYLRLHEAGAFERYAKTELIDGVVYAMNPQHRPHGFAKDELAYRLRKALEAMGSDLHVATEQSVAMAPHTQPEPDIILTTEPRGPGPIPSSSVALLVEIAASSAGFDLNEMVRAYAAAGIPEYWVVDVNARVIHRLWSPQGEAYAERREVKFGEGIEAATIEGLAVETSGIN